MIKGKGLRRLSFYNKDLEISKKVGNDRGMARTKTNRGILYKEHGQRDEAKKLLEQSLRVSGRVGDTPNAELAREHLDDL